MCVDAWLQHHDASAWMHVCGYSKGVKHCRSKNTNVRDPHKLKRPETNNQTTEGWWQVNAITVLCMMVPQGRGANECTSCGRTACAAACAAAVPTGKCAQAFVVQTIMWQAQVASAFCFPAGGGCVALPLGNASPGSAPAPMWGRQGPTDSSPSADRVIQKAVGAGQIATQPHDSCACDTDAEGSASPRRIIEPAGLHPGCM